MTRAAQILAIGAAALIAACLALFLFRTTLIEAALVRALAAAGLENPSLDVASVGLARIDVRDIKAGDPRAPALRIAAANAEFSLADLIAKRQVKTFTVSGARAVATLIDGKQLQIVGYRPRQTSGAASLPFEALSISDVELTLRSDDSSAAIRIDGRFSPAEGGAFAVEAGSAGYGLAGLQFSEATARATIELASDGGLSLRAAAAADISGLGLSLQETTIDLTGEGSSWRSLLSGDASGLAGGARLRAQTGQSPAADNPLIAGFFTVSPTEAPRFLSASGDIRLSFGNGGVVISSVEGPAFSAMSDLGARVLIDAGPNGGALFESGPARRRLAVSARVDGEGLGGGATLEAAARPEGPWRFIAGGAFGDQAIRGAAFGATEFRMEGEADRQRIIGEAVVSTLVRSATVGRLAIADAPLVLRASLLADIASNTATIDSLTHECLRVERARLALEGMNNEARLADSLFCRKDAPLATIRWGADPHVDVAGRLTAARGSYVIGATRFEGAPPIIDLTASYDPDQQLTVASGAVTGGRIIINGAIVASETTGLISARFDTGGLSGEAALQQVKIAQNASPMQVAPALMTGTARLAADVMTFDYVARTVDGRQLGVGEGVHEVASGRGRTTIRSGELSFAPQGLQPAKVLLALRGVVAETYGEAFGEATFVWGPKPSDFKSSGKISLRDLRFVGPGRAVSKTVGVNGDVTLTSLAPLQSESVQEIRVGLVDLDALQLENGVIHLAFPGDGTMKVIDAAFPWFGGRIGAYDAVASLSGQNITTELKAADVDLGQMLAFLKVDGLSGEGTVEGTLPLSISDGRARIVDGLLSAKGPGVLRYAGPGLEAAAATGPEARLAFDILRDLHFEELTAKIDGPLDGSLRFNVVLKGVNEVNAGGSRVRSPVIYRISLEAPILSLIDQARISSDFRLQLEGMKSQSNTTD